MGVILDVVYNHLGPDGCYLREFASAYFSARYKNEWGEALNFDGADAGPVREFFVANAGYWMDEYHLDGLRLDATQQIFDRSAEHVLTAIGLRRSSYRPGCRKRTAGIAPGPPCRRRRLWAGPSVGRGFPSQRDGCA